AGYAGPRRWIPRRAQAYLADALSANRPAGRHVFTGKGGSATAVAGGDASQVSFPSATRAPAIGGAGKAGAEAIQYRRSGGPRALLRSGSLGLEGRRGHGHPMR